jgi:UDP-N-acetyl-D-mannosaminuronate dehydrogenase
MKDAVVGLGEIGKPIFILISKHVKTVGYDKNTKLIPKSSQTYMDLPTRFLHICIPYNKSFNSNIKKLTTKFSPKGIIIHSTLQPRTTTNLQSSLDIPIIYSATRGVHKRMLRDLRRYTKFFAIEKNAPDAKWASSQFSLLMKKAGVKTKRMSDPLTLELAKIVCDTSYYGWLINYAQISQIIASKNKVDYDEMWSFAGEIHKYLGNRPKMFPGYIGGHCVIPNLELLNDEFLNKINKINDSFKKLKI